MTQQEVEQNPRVITVMLFAFDRWVHVLIDPGAMFSFISSHLARAVNPPSSEIGFDKLIKLPHGEIFYAQWEFRHCPVYVEGVLFKATLIPFNLVKFDLILRMYWLYVHDAHVGCRSKMVTFPQPRHPDIVFQGEQRIIQNSVISAHKAMKSLKKGCERFLAFVVEPSEPSVSVNNVYCK